MMEKMERVFGAPVLEAYGMTEASHQMASNPQPPAARKPGSVGPGTGVRIGIMDEAGNLLPRAARRSGDPGAERGVGLREQSRGQCEIVHQRLVPHRRSGLSRCGRLSDADRAGSRN
jgi:acyl-CoA synthetase (AMP-forming)/AMP-acid ligase II